MEKIPSRRGTPADVAPNNAPVSRAAHGDIPHELWGGALQSESFEDVAAASEDVEALWQFRQSLGRSPFGSFHGLIEQVTLIERLPTTAEQSFARKMAYVERARGAASALSPRVADAYLALTALLTGERYEPAFPELTNAFIERLTSTTSSDGGVRRSDVDVLFSGDTSWQLKASYARMGLEGLLAGRRALDRREGSEMADDIREWRRDQLERTPPTPPPSTDRSKPGVDPMERLKEGEKAPSWWRITPPWRAFYRESAFSRWDAATNEWAEERRFSGAPATAPLSGNRDPNKGPIDITLSGTVPAGAWFSAPIPYTHGLFTIKADHGSVIVEQDQNGGVRFQYVGQGDGTITIELAPVAHKVLSAHDGEPRPPDMPCTLTRETQAHLAEIAGRKQGTLSSAQAVRAYVQRTVRYLAPKTPQEAEEFNILCRTHPRGFAGAVDEAKKGDCDVVNTYFAALCAQVGVPVRHVVGHSVTTKDGIHSGTGHAWSEVWDDRARVWVRMDATPPGDPNMGTEPRNNKQKAIPGEGAEEDIIFSIPDSELQKLRERLAAHRERLSYTSEERTLAEALAQRAGKKAEGMLARAREIRKEISAAEDTRLPDGTRVIEALSTLFGAIVDARKTTSPTYDGPVRRSDGGERIQRLIKHFIGVRAGDRDPESREKEEREEREEQVYGGFDLYMIADKSGSMGGAQYESKLVMQRRATYLIFASLYEFAVNMQRAGIHNELALDIRTQGISFRGDDKNKDLDIDKPCSREFTPLDKVTLWDSLSQGGGGNGDSMALNYVSSQIHEEIAELAQKKSAATNRLRVVIACSDGGYVGDEAAMRDLAEELGALGVVVVGMGLTADARSVKAVMHNPPHSYGDIVESINDLPAVVARYVVQEALRLFPAKALNGSRAHATVQAVLAKFQRNT